jgi:hypothetical protein
MYPHRNELIANHAEVVRMFVEMARNLGRRVVTDADEARQILGIKLTSSLPAKSKAKRAAVRTA